MCVEENAGMCEKFGFRAIELDDMPRYFQRMKKLFDLSKLLHKTDEGLLVMKVE